jgi:peptidoglycan/LPS O-acetylase OafA/YrhL
VEAARGLAAILVVLVHATDMLAGPHYFGTKVFGGLFRFAHAGVDFFFVLSGFIIFHVHRDDLGRVSKLGEYLRRRFVRIFPTYWVVLAFYGAILVFSPTQDHYERNIEAILSSITLVPIGGKVPILNVAWTLQHEMLFYTLFGVMFFSRTGGRIVLGSWAALIGWNMLTGRFDAFPENFLFSIFNIEFFFGIGLAILLARRRVLHPAVPFIAGMIIFFGTGLFESFAPQFSPAWITPHLLYATGATLALYGIASAEMDGGLREIPKWIVALGTASYSIYLMHTVVIMILQQGIRALPHFTALPLAPIFFALVVATVIICERFSFYVEQPLLRWCRHALAPRRVQIAGVARVPLQGQLVDRSVSRQRRNTGAS